MTTLPINDFIPMRKIYMIFKYFEQSIKDINYLSDRSKSELFHKQYVSDLKMIFKNTLHSMEQITDEYNLQVSNIKRILQKQKLEMSIWEIHQKAIERTKRKLVYQTYH